MKKGTETVIDRIFITGVAPITLDSLTSGFNVGKDITQDSRFNEMMGFTQEELIEMLDRQKISKEEQEEILPIMKNNYDGYKFSIGANKQIYNSNMCLYFLSEYIWSREIPSRLIDMNIASDYSKLGNMLDLCVGENREEILERTISGEGIASEITKEIAQDGKIDKILELLKTYINNLSNRDLIKFDEKYVKLIFYCISMNLNLYRVKSEMELQTKYPDLLLIPKQKPEEYYSVMIEFKYLKKEEKKKLFCLIITSFYIKIKRITIFELQFLGIVQKWEHYYFKIYLY